jgi:hypothetical protein
VARPGELVLNAYTGGTAPVRGGLPETSSRWALRTAPSTLERFLKPPPPANPHDFLDARVGWAMVVAEQPGFSAEQFARNEDLCPLLRQLLDKRGNGAVLRYRPGSEHRLTLLRDYANGKDLDLAGSPIGRTVGAIPRYLLMVGGPSADELPWALQYILSLNRNVGRLPFHPLKEEALLAPYVQACLDDWSDAGADLDATLVWGVDHGDADISHLLRVAIADEVARKYAGDADLQAKAVRIDAADATHGRLRQALAATRPGVVVTTSHGMTGPLSDRRLMTAQLGLPVDRSFEPLPLAALLAAWQPDGAIWYAHACCASGADRGSVFTELFSDSPARQVLQAVGELGAQVAPLPLALLSAAKPARAFLGHVEPTFDWTVRQPATGQFLSASLVAALYDELFLSAPIGHAFRGWYANAATHFAAWDEARRGFDGQEASKAAVLYHTLAARDIQTLVLLGDPAVALPP